VPKRVKYLGINLTKEVKDLQSENYETLVKEIEDDINKWKDIPCLWTGRTSIVKMFTLHKAIYRFNAISIKMPNFHRTRANNPKICMEPPKNPKSQSNLEKKNEVGGITILVFKIKICRNHNSITLAEIETHRSMKQNRVQK